MKVAVAGDWHGNRKWMASQIPVIARMLDGQPQRVILQAGDFGVFAVDDIACMVRRIPTWLQLVQAELESAQAELWFIDGNHDDHPYLAELAARYDAGPQAWLTDRIRWLPRGTRWQWDGKTWLACGGAVSVDKNMRHEGRDWFPDEEITAEQEEEIIAGGHADVILAHDAPRSEPLRLGVPPLEWLPMIPKAEEHREVLQRICQGVQPSHYFHGHYHRFREYPDLAVPWGRCSFTALDMDGTHGNWGILDTGTMKFSFPEELP